MPLEIDRSAREVVTEIGNIVLNACLGTFGNLLKVQVSFSVPHLTLDTLESVVGSVAVDRQGVRYALIIHSSFRLRNSSLTGYLVIVLGVASIERLMHALERWQQEQH
jgi:chemotaxis protein CheC